MTHRANALVDKIIAECRKQGFTIEEVQGLVNLLQFMLDRRRNETEKESF